MDRDRPANALSMPASFVNNPKHWEERAADMRALAGQMSDGEAKKTMLRIAKDYEKLAQRASAASARAIGRDTSLVKDSVRSGRKRAVQVRPPHRGTSYEGLG